MKNRSYFIGGQWKTTKVWIEMKKVPISIDFYDKCEKKKLKKIVNESKTEKWFLGQKVS